MKLKMDQLDQHEIVQSDQGLSLDDEMDQPEEELLPGSEIDRPDQGMPLGGDFDQPDQEPSLGEEVGQDNILKYTSVRNLNVTSEALTLAEDRDENKLSFHREADKDFKSNQTDFLQESKLFAGHDDIIDADLS